MNNLEFLTIISRSFEKFLNTSSQSNQKLVILHGAIANDLSQKLGEDYIIKSLGDNNGGKEAKIQGRYLSKTVDIAIIRDNIPIAGIGVKFVMQNYSQNSVNYFENMLGETANIRSNKIPYFQIFIIPDKIPYYANGGKFKHWETFSEHNAEKYLILSKDEIDCSLHTPNKTLLFVIHIPEISRNIENKDEYISFYRNINELNIELSSRTFNRFDNSVIYNDYEMYIDKVVHYIKSL